MAETFDDPWMKAKSGKAAACHYGCGKLADLTEPGKPWKAHKVCALGWGPSEPMGAWNGEEHKAVPDGPYGCGDSSSPIISGRQCGSAGDRLTCALCPRSPGYWRRDEAR